jgi:hypothetical protein
MSDNQKLIEDFQRAFKFSRFEEQKTFGDARNEAIAAACALHGGSIHDHAELFELALKDLCLKQRDLWGHDIRPDDNRWFQHFEKRALSN